MGYPSMVKKYADIAHGNLSIRYAGKAGVKYLVIHYTGGMASAKNNCIYFSREGAKTKASADYFIETNGKIYKYNGNCKTHYSWHCGDGHGAYGITNANSIGIEVVSDGREFTTAQKKALRSLVKAIQSDYGIKAANVVRHYDASRKLCPAAYCGSTAKDKKWKELHAYITAGKLTTTSTAFKPYKVKVTVNGLNVRNGAGTKYKVNTTVKKGGVYTIVQEKNGWGKLRSGAGWIYLAYTKKV